MALVESGEPVGSNGVDRLVINGPLWYLPRADQLAEPAADEFVVVVVVVHVTFAATESIGCK
jgi:hypothetical protein